MTPELEWQEFAACIDQDIEMFFVPMGGVTEPAKKICSKCPVKRECLDYAMRNNEGFGVWGGLSAHERRNLKRRLKRRVA